LPIISKREHNVPGTHSVVYASPVDEIEIKHTAHSREGFATGAVLASEWLQGRQGVFGMEDMLGF
jgi:4-hydroxy-tetrahydrodipicolinate reductase